MTEFTKSALGPLGPVEPTKAIYTMNEASKLAYEMEAEYGGVFQIEPVGVEDGPNYTARSNASNQWRVVPKATMTGRSSFLSR